MNLVYNIIKAKNVDGMICHGDSGSPMIVRNNGSFYQIGNMGSVKYFSLLWVWKTPSLKVITSFFLQLDHFYKTMRTGPLASRF